MRITRVTNSMRAVYTSLATAWPVGTSLAEGYTVRRPQGVLSHFRDRILSITTFGFAVVLAVGASAQPIQRVTNPYTAKQIQSMLHPSASAIPHVLYQSRARSTIERLLEPQLKKLRTMGGYSAPSESHFDFEESQEQEGNPLRFRSASTWSAAPSGDPSDVYAIAVADFDRRNGPDVATVQTDGTLNILYNRGNGKLSIPYVNTSAVVLNPAVTTKKQSRSERRRLRRRCCHGREEQRFAYIS